MKHYLFFAILLFPVVLSAKYMDTRDITAEKNQVQQLLRSKRDTSGAEAAKASADAIFAAGATLAAVGRSRYYYYNSYYYRPAPPPRPRPPSYGYYPYGRPRPYYDPALTTGRIMMASAAASSAVASAEIEAIRENNEVIEQQIVGIIQSLVQTDEDFKKESQALNLRLSNDGEQLKMRLDESAKNQLKHIYAPSNQMESDFQEALQAVPARYNVSQYERSLNALSNQILGIEPITRPMKDIKAETKNISKALKTARKEQAKEIKTLTKQATKSRKAYAKSLRPSINRVLVDRQDVYDAFIEKSSGEIDTLFKTYYQAYFVKLM